MGSVAGSICDDMVERGTPDREGTGQPRSGGRRERTGGCLYSETPLAKFSNFFLFFTYPLTRTSESKVRSGLDPLGPPASFNP